MKLKMNSRLITILLPAAIALTLTSCFKEEPLNAECDIEQAYIHTADYQDIFLQASDTLIQPLSNEDNITFMVKRGTDLSQMAPLFKLTSGAQITPASGTMRDFSQGTLAYTTISEDGNWSRTYNVSFTYPPIAYEEMKYDFETFFLNENRPVHKYYVWSDKNDDGTLANNWATGNAGYQMSDRNAKPEDYPTVPIEKGHDGAAVKLTTRSTGAFGDMVNMPLAAGNLFTGKFDVSQATIDAMKATQFGMPVSFKPVKFSGWYKYKRGEVFTNREKQVLTDRKDYGTIYAVLYDNHDEKGNAIVLYGDNVQTSPQVVALAILPNIDDTPDWTHFELDFEYKKDIDPEKLANMGYSLAIVSSSSVEGASFMGAVGSTLWIDQYRITCEKGDE